ncbi:MAG: DUF1501 domain-containing protein [Chthonomonadales bacterium]|nr:DUF1501 domain-containing protein [Chthonomonadales bacterium]
MSESGEMTRRALLCRGIIGAAALRTPIAEPGARSVIRLRMDGGPSQYDTWAPDPGGLFRAIPTTSPALRFCEPMPGLAQQAHRLAVLANVRVPEINHRRARYLVCTGVQAPPSVVPELPLPSYSPATQGRVPTSAALRYGASDFGRQCFEALTHIERGARFAEAVLPGWDTHTDAAPRLRRLLAAMDRAMSALLDDLAARDLLRSTLVLWMGDFGRTQAVNRMGGRDHDPERSCVVLAGAGVRGGVMVRREGARLADVFATIAAVAPLYRDRRTAKGEPVRSLLA